MKNNRHARLCAALLCAFCAAAADGSVAGLVASIREALLHHRRDDQIARDLRRVKLTERLDDRTIEALESEGAGSRTIAELQRLRKASAGSARPPVAVIPEPAEPGAGDREIVWQVARDKALNYTASLPDFICTEIVKRYLDPSGKDGWRLSDTLSIKLNYFDHQEDYRLVSVNKRAVQRSYEQAGGAITEGEFGSTLSGTFSPASRADYRWDHWTTLRGRAAHVYSFRISKANSQYRVGVSGVDIKVGQHGFVYIDRETNITLRIAAEADDVPIGFPVQHTTMELDYGFAEVAGKQYLLPLHARTQFQGDGLWRRNDVDFVNYQKFSADANITFAK
jgi:hypothetical protein